MKFTLKYVNGNVETIETPSWSHFVLHHMGKANLFGLQSISVPEVQAARLPKLTLPNGSSRTGAQMGRHDVLPDNRDAAIKLQMQRLRWVSGDYDEKGCYWGGGSGDWVYCAWQDEIRVFVRGENREQAKLKVREKLPRAKFYR